MPKFTRTTQSLHKRAILRNTVKEVIAAPITCSICFENKSCKGTDKHVCKSCIVKLISLSPGAKARYRCPHCRNVTTQEWFKTDVSALQAINILLREHVDTDSDDSGRFDSDEDNEDDGVADSEDEETEMIFTSIRNGNEDVVRRWIKEDPMIVNHCSEVTGIPVTHYIAQHGTEALQMKVFSELATDVNALYDTGHTVLALHQYEDVSAAAFQAIVTRRDFKHVNYHDGFKTMLHFHLYCCCISGADSVHRFKAITLLNHPEIDLTLKDYRGRTALDVAKTGGLEDIHALINRK